MFEAKRRKWYDIEGYVWSNVKVYETRNGESGTEFLVYDDYMDSWEWVGSDDCRPA